ncbi:hypothetical protein D3C84_954060 [compost metagenome]
MIVVPVIRCPTIIQIAINGVRSNIAIANFFAVSAGGLAEGHVGTNRICRYRDIVILRIIPTAAQTSHSINKCVVVHVSDQL